jgi:hypothetical protein
VLLFSFRGWHGGCIFPDEQVKKSFAVDPAHPSTPPAGCPTFIEGPGKVVVFF